MNAYEVGVSHLGLRMDLACFVFLGMHAYLAWRFDLWVG